MTFWTILVFLHAIGWATFLGGQIMLGFMVVPALRNDDPEGLRKIARSFGVASLIALGLLILTGMMLASHFHLWSYGPFHVKMALATLTVIAVLVHLKWANAHWLMGLVFLLTLATVYSGINLMH
ncbi:MAG: hypothetical protein M9938_03490 [Solirubrobacterales bacterium]|nr:hypothetical protein [Solirubrobacterales bacterium]